MPDLDRNLCRDTLARLIAEESATLVQLERLLDREHATILANDVEALALAGDERHAGMASLLRIEDERRALCRMLGATPDAAGLHQLLTWCDPGQSLRKAWEACAASAGRCRDRNDRNGALVAVRLKRVEGALGALTGEKAGTYGPRGLYRGVRASRVVATEA
jgi:flagellar biosynthesis/type III secretory pathway chaperone